MVIEFKSTRTGDYRLKYIERKETQKIAKVNRVTHGPSLFFLSWGNKNRTQRSGQKYNTK